MHVPAPLARVSSLERRFAVALGDAFGYLVEFDSLADIRAKYGPSGLVDLSQSGAPAHFSDDTQMTLYTLDGLLDVLEWANDGVGADVNACQWLAYLRWLKTQGIPAAGHAPEQPPRWIDAQSMSVLGFRRGRGGVMQVARQVDALADQLADAR